MSGIHKVKLERNLANEFSWKHSFKHASKLTLCKARAPANKSDRNFNYRHVKPVHAANVKAQGELSVWCK
eukprot:1142540-Pelagomonas_calceolata.AAC.2